MSGNSCLLTLLLLAIAAPAAAQDRPACPPAVDIPTAETVAQARACGDEELARGFEQLIAARGDAVAEEPATAPEPAASEPALPPGPLAGPGEPVVRSGGGGGVAGAAMLPGFLGRAPACDGRGAGACWVESMGLRLWNGLSYRTGDSRRVRYAVSVQVDGRDVVPTEAGRAALLPVVMSSGAVQPLPLVPFEHDLYVMVGRGRHRVEFQIYEQIYNEGGQLVGAARVGSGWFTFDPASGAVHALSWAEVREGGPYNP